MIVKGKSRSNGVQLGAYLLSMEVNEEVRVLDISGMATDDLAQALIEMQEITDRGQRGVKGLYHAVISPQPGYALNEEQWLYAADVLAKQLKLHDQPRAIVLHEKADGQGGTRTHAHIVFQRTDKERLILVPDSWNYIAHERAARHLEQKFGHELVPGKHVEPKEQSRDKQTAPDHERHQDARSGLTKEERIAQVTELFRQSDGAKGFAASLAHAGYTLAVGDRRDFVILDKTGQVYALPRCIEGVRTKELRKFMEPLNAGELPNVEQAKQLIHDARSSEQARHAQKDKAKTGFEKAAQQPETAQRAEQKVEKPANGTKEFERVAQDTPAKAADRVRGKAKRDMTDAASDSAVQRYARSLASRLGKSRDVARSVKERLGALYGNMAARLSEGIARIRSRVGKGKAGARGVSFAPMQEAKSEKRAVFNRAAKALDQVRKEKAASSERSAPDRKGPSHDR